MLQLAALAVGSGPFNQTIIEIFIRVVLVVGLYVFIGNSGVISFGHIGFTCLGAYMTAWLTMLPAIKKSKLKGLPDIILNNKLAYGWGLLAAVIFAAIAAYIVGKVLMRLSGIAASIATFAVLAVIIQVYSNWDSVTGAQSSVVGIPIVRVVWPYFLCAVIVVAGGLSAPDLALGPRAARGARRGDGGLGLGRRHSRASGSSPSPSRAASWALAARCSPIRWAW